MCLACCMVKNHGLAYVSWVLHGQKSRLGPWWGGFWLWCLTGFACVSWVLRGQTSQRRFQMCVSRPHIFVRCIVLFLVAFGFVNTSCPDAFGSLFCFQMHLVVSTMWFCQHGFCCFVDCVFVCDVCHGTFCQRGVCCFVDLSIACLCVMCVAARFANAEFVVLSIACL